MECKCVTAYIPCGCMYPLVGYKIMLDADKSAIVHKVSMRFTKVCSTKCWQCTSRVGYVHLFAVMVNPAVVRYRGNTCDCVWCACDSWKDSSNLALIVHCAIIREENHSC